MPTIVPGESLPNGDLLLVLAVSTATVTPPDATWTAINNRTAGVQVFAFTHIVAGETPVYVFTTTGFCWLWMVQIRSTGTLNVESSNWVTSTAVSSSITIPAVTPNAVGALTFYIVAAPHTVAIGLPATLLNPNHLPNGYTRNSVSASWGTFSGNAPIGAQVATLSPVSAAVGAYVIIAGPSLTIESMCNSGQ